MADLELWANFVGDEASFDLLQNEFSGIRRRDGQLGVLLSGSGVVHGDDQRFWGTEAREFQNFANRTLALAAPFAMPIEFGGYVIAMDAHGQCVGTYSYPEAGRIEFSSGLSGLQNSTPPPSRRSLAERQRDLEAQEPHFQNACQMLAEAGEDLRELFRVAEAIQKAHGGLPKKSDAARRRAFFQSTQIPEGPWDALHRACRPVRHYKEHDDGGAKLTAKQARQLLKHALSLWLDRVVPI